MFQDLYKNYPWEKIEKKITPKTQVDLKKIILKDFFSPEDIISLLSPAAEEFLELLAQKAARITKDFFGKTIQLYTPMYLSNQCQNCCQYCGFNAQHQINRITLDLKEIKKEADFIYKMGIRHLLLVSGEDRKALPVKFLAQIATKIHKNFSSLGLEIYPLEIDEYKLLIDSGVDALTIYQETYNPQTYAQVHLAGPKKNFFYRLDVPDKGGQAGFRKIGIGALLGLADWRVEGFYLALHALYLSKKYWQSQIQISFPRIQESWGGFQGLCPISDKALTHLIAVMRIINPTANLIISTRESETLRKNLLPIGITSMSAGSRTSPGAYTLNSKQNSQFNIQDNRSPKEVATFIKAQGYDPVWKDWDKNFLA